MAETTFRVIYLGLLLLAHLALAGWVYLEAPDRDMHRLKWTAISLLIPVFGFFAFLLEREEQLPDTDRDEMFVDGAFEIHKSRADDVPWLSKSETGDEETDGHSDDDDEADR